MKRSLFFIAVVMLVYTNLCGCRTAKDIQVVCRVWTLIKKEPATRLVDNEASDFIWLVWRDDRGEEFRERVTKQVAAAYVEGIHIPNRDRR
jgi:hypothetical protein